ncbi:Serine/threonine-protein kinase [Lachnellula subtilissima]|uniref:Serine/threonine-protein kinase n=1 Tax=Lachnellula subtilissima TaxID=602034 RepID=A0A8H8S2J4_9HELO|nr:Serine/threonine-protein kinase [Lachnellula subtilissima]
MPDLYRAPEIVLGVHWNEKIDIWSVGLMIWDLFEGKHTLIALMGPPPKDLLQRGQLSATFFNADGNFTPDILLEETSLDKEEENLKGEEKNSLPSISEEDGSMGSRG